MILWGSRPPRRRLSNDDVAEMTLFLATVALLLVLALGALLV